MDVRALIFDMGNVIIKFDAEAVRRVFICNDPARECLPVVSEGWPEVIEYECGRLTTPAFARHVSELIGREIALEEFDNAWGPVFHLNQPVAELLPALRERYPLVLLSNTNDSHWRWLKQNFASALAHFDPCLLSFELKRMKPEPEVYQQAAAATGQLAQYCLFIDDVEANVVGARAAGLQAVRYVGPETDALLRSLL